MLAAMFSEVPALGGEYYVNIIGRDYICHR